MPIKKITFQEFLNGLQILFPGGSFTERDLLPDVLYDVAKSRGCKIESEAINQWAEFESGAVDFDANDFDRFAFGKLHLSPAEKLYILTDFSFQERSAFEIRYEDFEQFVDNDYAELYQGDFFQPSDYIILIPRKQKLIAVHHEGVVISISRASVLSKP